MSNTCSSDFRIIMTEYEIKERLKTLAEDINSTDTDAMRSLMFYCDASEEQEDLIRNMYAQEHAPVHTSDTDGFSSGDKENITQYEEFVSGYESYLNRTLKEYYEKTRRQKIARDILVEVMNLPCVHTRVIYYTYLHKMSIHQVCDSLFMSRSTYYRYHKEAIMLIAKRYNEKTGS